MESNEEEEKIITTTSMNGYMSTGQPVSIVIETNEGIKYHPLQQDLGKIEIQG